MNIPLSSVDSSNDRDYITIINELVLPIMKQFKPELIIVCVDFCIQKLIASCYTWIIGQLNIISNSQLAVALDGNLSCIASRIFYIQTVLCVLIDRLSSINNDKWETKVDINIHVRRRIDLIKEKYKQY